DPRGLARHEDDWEPTGSATALLLCSNAPAPAAGRRQSVRSGRASPVPVLNMVLSRPFVDNRLRGDCTGRRRTQPAGRSRRRKGLLQDDDPRNGSLEQRRSSESEGLWSQNAPKDAPNAPKSYTPNLLISNGGRDRTRTCDLLRVKYQNRF